MKPIRKRKNPPGSYQSYLFLKWAVSPHFLRVQIPKKNPELSTRSQCWLWLLDKCSTSYCQWDTQNALKTLHVFLASFRGTLKSPTVTQAGLVHDSNSTCGPLVQIDHTKSRPRGPTNIWREAEVPWAWEVMTMMMIGMMTEMMMLGGWADRWEGLL